MSAAVGTPPDAALDRGAYELSGDPFGKVYPARAPLPLPAVDPRTVALSVLRKFVGTLVFHRPDTAGKTVAFQIPKERFHIEQPDHEQDVVFPSMVCVSTEEEEYDSPGFLTQYDEASRDRFGLGSVLQVQYEQKEFFRLEMWGSTKPERRAMLAGMQVALNPTEQLYGVRFKMLGYYGQTVCFTPWSLIRRDADAVRGRRVAAMRIEMRFNVVSLVNYNPINQIHVTTEVTGSEAGR